MDADSQPNLSKTNAGLPELRRSITTMIEVAPAASWDAREAAIIDEALGRIVREREVRSEVVFFALRRHA